MKAEINICLDIYLVVRSIMKSGDGIMHDTAFKNYFVWVHFLNFSIIYPILNLVIIATCIFFQLAEWLAQLFLFLFWG